jgi:hypothetical protein
MTTENLLSEGWTDSLDPLELRLFLKEGIGGLGQYTDGNKHKLYLPLAGQSCQIELTFDDDKIVTIVPGPAFDSTKWEKLSQEIEKSILTDPTKVGRDYSFSTFRVSGWWRGPRSGIQIVRPPDDAPHIPGEGGDHPFVLEFPTKISDSWSVTNYRRMREHRALTLALNVFLAGRTSLLPRRPEHFWASIPHEIGRFQRV